MQSTQRAVNVFYPALFEDQSPRLWVRQEIVYMHWYSLWAQSSSSRPMSVDLWGPNHSEMTVWC